MSDDRGELSTAEARSQLARSRLAGTLAEIQARLKPAALAREAIGELRETGQEIASAGLAAVKRHPLRVAGTVAAIGLVAARKWFTRGAPKDTHKETTPAKRRYRKRTPPDATKGTKA